MLPEEALQNSVKANLAHAIYRDFLSGKNSKFSVENVCYFSYFGSKHRLWVHIRTASAVPTIYVLEQK